MGTAHFVVALSLLLFERSALGLSTGPGLVSSVRGMHPDLARWYTGKDGSFSCRDGSRTMPFDRVNDNYCDCIDGSDEPGAHAEQGGSCEISPNTMLLA